MRYVTLTSISKEAFDNLYYYNEWMGRKIKPEFIKEFEPYLPKHPITIYRGMSFDILDGARILKKFRIKPEIGSKGIYSTKKIQSWTLDKKVAYDFTHNGSLQIIINTTVKPQDIAIPVAYLPSSIKNNLYCPEQKEILLKPGTFNITVVEIQGNWNIVKDTSLKSIFKKGEIIINKTLNLSTVKVDNYSFNILLTKINKSRLPRITIGIVIQDKIHFYAEPHEVKGNLLVSPKLDFEDAKKYYINNFIPKVINMIKNLGDI